MPARHRSRSGEAGGLITLILSKRKTQLFGDIMLKQAIESILSFFYFILFYSVIILAYIFSNTALGNWLKKKASALAPE